MSPPPHREKDAKVEGRDPPDLVEETIAPFKSLMAKLLKVPMSEVKGQQKLYEKMRAKEDDTVNSLLRRKKVKVAKVASADSTASLAAPPPAKKPR